MTSSHGRRIQSRRALAIMAWVTLVVVAWLLWYGQHKRIIRIQAWEPAALLLAAYCTFLAIFGWLLFSPGRKSAEESPGLFFGGMLTLLPPCFIAYHLMPVGSPLKPWLTIGVFVFGIIAIMSPLPEEVFAVPRDRRTYLQPLTDAYLSDLNIEEPQLHFDDVSPRTEYWLTQPNPPDISNATEARDPWSDPFQGTGRQLSRIGVSQSRRSPESSRTERRRLSEPTVAGTALAEPSSLDHDEPPKFGNLSPRLVPARAQSEDGTAEPKFPGVAKNRPARGPNHSAPVSSDPPAQVQQVLAPRPIALSRLTESRPSGNSVTMPPVPPMTSGSLTVPSAIRRPLTEPTGRPLHPVGFQTPVSPAKTISTPPPLPVVPVSSNIAATPPPIPIQALAWDAGSIKTEEMRTTPEISLRELDRQLREQESVEAAESEEVDGPTARPVESAQLTSGPGVTRTVQQTSSDLKLERIRDEHGGEMIEGTIKVFFDVGQKRAHLHVPFSPPLAGLPEVECEPTDDDSIRLKVAVRQPYGVRIEARRADAAESLWTEVSFAAVYTPTIRRS